jgi:hypothetical protein
MVQGRFVMASWARRLFQISHRNNNGKEWVILQITQLEYLQTNVLMFRWRTFIFDVKFRLDCTTIGPIDSFQFKIVWLYRGRRQMAALYIQLGKAYYIRILTLKLDN